MKRLSTVVIIGVFVFAVNATMAQTAPGNNATGASLDPAVVKKLQEVVTIRQRLVEANQRAVQSGKGERDGRYELALAEARLQLARELGQQKEQVAALQDILKVQQRRLEAAKKAASVAVVSPEDVDTIRIAVLETEVRLLRAQNSLKKP